jgi:hypothetical protein
VLTRVIVCLIVFVLNLVPAFAPPTWMAMSYLGVAKPLTNPLEWSLIGATAATAGRVLLARLSRVVIRHKLLSASTRQNIDSIREKIENRRKVTAMLFLFYAFSPLPSNQLFISYGLTTLPLRLIALPFFFGRVVSYTFWAFTASTAARKMEFDVSEASSYLGVYFIVSQIALLFLVYVFTKIDWAALLSERKLRWHRPPVESRR